jgi:shikimate kinase
MLIAQALETWRIWFGARPEIDLEIEMGDYLRNRPLFLTGFMGAGKSTIGPLLAKTLGWNFIETDLEIEKKAGRSISDLFREKGESHFRELEHQTVLEHAFSSRTVISLGGGALTHVQTREFLKNTGRLVFLTASPQVLNDRLRHQAAHRPLLAGLSEEERVLRIESLLKEREPFYNLAAFRLDTASMSAEQAAQKIREKFL